MRVLVTGAGGFVGRHVVAELIRRKHTVTAIGRSREPAEFLNRPEVAYRSYDINARPPMLEELGRPSALIDLAWQGLPNYESIAHIDDNVMPHYNLVRSLTSQGLHKVVAIGTCLEYGRREGRLTEDMEPAPAIAYAVAKNAVRSFVEQWRRIRQFEFQWVRLFYLYGAGQSPRSLFAQLDEAIERRTPTFAMSHGEQMRDYMSVQDCANQIVSLCETHCESGVYNCCGGTPTSVRRLVEERIARSGVSIKLDLGVYDIPSYEPMSFWGDNRKLSRAITAK